MQSNLLKIEMLKKNKSINDIAKCLNKSKATVYLKFNNKIAVSRDDIIKISQLLELNREQRDEIFFS